MSSAPARIAALLIRGAFQAILLLAIVAAPAYGQETGAGTSARPWANFAKYFDATPVVATPTDSASRSAAAPAQAVAPVAAPAVAPVAAPAVAPVAAPAVAPVAAPAAAPAAAAAVGIGFGTIKFNGNLQMWYTNGTGVADNTFRVRRAELRILGQINPKVSWVLHVDAAKALAVSNTYTTINGMRVLADQSVSQTSRILQDGFVTISLRRALLVDVGQLKIPFTNEGLVAPWKIETVEQPMYITDRARGGGYANVRDIGFMLRGTPFTRLDYFVGAFNGSGDYQNTPDRNDQKSVIARVVVRPALLRGLQVGASGVSGGAPSASRPRRDRAAAEAQYIRAKLTLRSEYVTGIDADQHRAGYYVHAGYKLRPSLEVLARFDTWDPDSRAESTAAAATATESLIGFTHFLAGNNAKVQVNLTQRDYAAQRLPSIRMLMVNVQAAW